ncbi:MAG: hypothetical protein HC846_12875 [Blastocatellia bacterium]|nr:hypothetical protein [Blastocatellia bacterium]
MEIKAGAGGDWKRLNEEFDLTIVRQFNDDACVSAVGEMLLRQQLVEITQQKIAENIGTPSNFELLAEYFNSLKISSKTWLGGFFDVKYFEKVVETGTWGAILREPKLRGHAVLVEGLTKDGLVKIKDPFDQTFYKMRKDEFLKYLSEFICEK